MRKPSFKFFVLLQSLIFSIALDAQESTAPQPIQKHEITDSRGRDITCYLSHPSSPAPLLLMIQGSGCGWVIKNFGSKKPSYGSTMFDLLPFAREGKFAVLAVEKPYFGPTSDGQAGTALPCSKAYNDDFTAESWLSALQDAVKDARKYPWVDSDRTLVLGESEGAEMAALLASHDKSVTDVAFLSGSGTTELFGHFALAYQKCPDGSCQADIETQVAAIEADPLSSTKFAWGHPYKRWSSFFWVDASEELLRTKARVYLAFGTADTSSPPVSGEVLAARLIVAKHDVTVRRVPNGNHMLLQDGSNNMGDLDKELRAVLSWFWSNNTQGLVSKH